MKKIRDEQKGLIFILLIILITIGLILFFSFTLRTNAVEDSLKDNPVVRTLLVIEDQDKSVLCSSVLILNTKSSKAALVNLPGYTGSIYSSLGRVDRLDKVYQEKGIDSYKSEGFPKSFRLSWRYACIYCRACRFD